MRDERLDHESDIQSICRTSKDDSGVDFDVVDDDNSVSITYYGTKYFCVLVVVYCHRVLFFM
jgi:hypothetical protein